MKRRAEMPEYRTQVANTVNRTSNVSIKGNDRTVSAPDTAMDKKQISSYSTLPRGTITMAEQAVREQKIYQTKDPFTKAEEKLFEGTINDKNIHEKQPDAMQVNMSQKATVSVNKNVVDSNENAETCDESAERVQEVEKEQKPQQLELFEEKLLAPESRSRHQLIGQIFDTYWLVQFEDKFFIIDQHAAHEKVYYERFVKRFREQTIESQYLSPPLIVSLNLQEEALLEANRKYFEDFGFEIEPFGGKEYCINAVPANLYGLEEEELFLEMLDNLASEKDKDPLGIFASRLATMACKAAVKGNHQMSDREANALIDELLTLENPYHCTHGRPTIISMTKTELEKKFKRIV